MQLLKLIEFLSRYQRIIVIQRRAYKRRLKVDFKTYLSWQDQIKKAINPLIIGQLFPIIFESLPLMLLIVAKKM